MDIMYAQVEQAQAIQDYPPLRPCVRLVGVASSDFQSESFNDPRGCAIHLIDIAWDHLLEARVRGAPMDPLFAGACAMHGCVCDDWPDGLWIELGYDRAEGVSGAYRYELFSDAQAEHIAVARMNLVKGPPVSLHAVGTGYHWPAQPIVRLSAFHVGQGMCALLHGPNHGMLIDAGAGVPIKRSTYRSALAAGAHTTFINDLRQAVLGLGLQAVISHPDSDHWRLLDWDLGLLSQTQTIYVPAGTPALALKSRQLVGRVQALAGHTTFWNGPGGAPMLEAHRSSPTVSDRNGECLVVHTHSGPQFQDHCLFPGDYVYDRMATDADPAIRALATSTFDAVMVPHHGDKASASVTVPPRIPKSSVAFFSAGTHTGYKHPTKASLKAHRAAKFVNIDRHACTDIIGRALP